MDCVFDEYVKFVENFLVNYFKLLLDKEYERNLVKPFIDRYIDVRYYNKFQYSKERSFTEKLNKELNNVAKEVIEDNEDKVEKIKNIFALFGYVLYIDGCFEYNSLSNLVKTLFSDKKITLIYKDNAKKELTYLIREFIEKKNGFFKIFDTDEFYLIGKKVFDDLYYVDMGNNCTMSKLYSEYAIDKAYNSEIVLENRVYLMLLMLTSKVLGEAIKLNFNNNYVFDFPESLLNKPKKIIRFLKVLDNDLLRSKIHIRFNYGMYKSKVFRKDILDLINRDYSVCLMLDDKYENDFDDLSMFTYVFVDQKYYYYNTVIENKDDFNTTIVTM